MKRVIFVSRCAWTLYNFRRDIMLEFMKRGYKVYALGGREGDYGEKLKGLGIEFIPLPIDKKVKNPLKDFYLLIRLIILYKRLSPDIVFHYTIKPIVYGSIATSFIRFENVYNFITGLGHLFIKEDSPLKRIGEFLYRVSLQYSSKVFFYNTRDFSYFFLEGITPIEKSYFIPGSGVDMDKFSPKGKDKRGIRVGMVARFLLEKGIKEFIEAAEHITNKIENIEFVAVGGKDERNPSSLSRKEIDKYKKIKGLSFIDRIDDIPGFLNSIDILSLPSYSEGLPRSLLEGASSSLSIVTTDIPGCRDVVDNGYTGYLVPPRDTITLRVFLLRLILSPSLRKKMGIRARKKIKALFSNERVFERIFGLID